MIIADKRPITVIFFIKLRQKKFSTAPPIIFKKALADARLYHIIKLL